VKRRDVAISALTPLRLGRIVRIRRGVSFDLVDCGGDMKESKATMDRRTPRLPEALEAKLMAFAHALVDQARARIVVPPNHPSTGFWFGGGNLTVDPSGDVLLVGRYRNRGDSRLGLAAGERGCELAIFRSSDRGENFVKALSFSKSDLSQSRFPVLSIEGSALYFGPSGVELFVSSEKDGIGYPAGLESFLKAGCGVWSIDRLAAKSWEELKQSRIETAFASVNPEFLHVKDPHVAKGPDGGLQLLFCTHPFCWSSSNTAFAVRPVGSQFFDPPRFDMFPRGATWDVAISRGSCLLDVPAVGSFRQTRVTLLFYDGGESLRNLDEHAGGVHRPRGYSCEELGGVAYCVRGDDAQFHRLSRNFPSFISPYGTGCSRYVDVLDDREDYYVTWQQSQPNGSQPLVMNVVRKSAAEELLR
jgi:hypothetical protein